MKGTELMLGDWVMHDGKPKKVDVIWSAKQVSLYDPSKDWGSIYTDKHSTDEIEPIPLTEEILIKNSFSNTRERWSIAAEPKRELSRDVFVIWRPEKMEYFYIMFNSTYYQIRYVHQLQNALRFLGIEKEIEL